MLSNDTQWGYVAWQLRQSQLPHVHKAIACASRSNRNCFAMALRWNCTAIMTIVQKICIVIAIVMRQLHSNCLNFSLDMQQLRLFCEAIVNVLKQLQLFCKAIAIVLRSNCNCFAKQLLKRLIWCQWSCDCHETIVIASD